MLLCGNLEEDFSSLLYGYLSNLEECPAKEVFVSSAKTSHETENKNVHEERILIAFHFELIEKRNKKSKSL